MSRGKARWGHSTKGGVSTNKTYTRQQMDRARECVGRVKTDGETENRLLLGMQYARLCYLAAAGQSAKVGEEQHPTASDLLDAKRKLSDGLSGAKKMLSGEMAGLKGLIRFHATNPQGASNGFFTSDLMTIPALAGIEQPGKFNGQIGLIVDGLTDLLDAIGQIDDQVLSSKKPTKPLDAAASGLCLYYQAATGRAASYWIAENRDGEERQSPIADMLSIVAEGCGEAAVSPSRLRRAIEKAAKSTATNSHAAALSRSFHGT